MGGHSEEFLRFEKPILLYSDPPPYHITLKKGKKEREKGKERKDKCLPHKSGWAT